MSLRLSMIVGALADKSLLQPSTRDDGEPQFTMLETVREFAIEQLGVERR